MLILKTSKASSQHRNLTHNQDTPVDHSFFAHLWVSFLSLPRAKTSEGRDSGARSEISNWLTSEREKSDNNFTMKMNMMRGKGIVKLSSSLEINKSLILAKDGIVF